MKGLYEREKGAIIALFGEGNDEREIRANYDNS